MNETTGIIAALLTVLSWTIGTFSFAKASRLFEPASVNRVRLMYATLLLALITCAWHVFSPWQLFSKPNYSQFFWFGLSGFIGLTLGDYFAFQAFKILGNRRTSLFSCFAPAAALVTGMLVLHEHISGIGILGMSISVAGIILLTSSRQEKAAVQNEGHGAFWKGVWMALLGAIGQGVGLVCAKKGFMVSGDVLSPVHATWIRMFVATICVYIIGLFKVNIWEEWKFITFHPTNRKYVFTGTLFGPIIGVSLSLLAASNMPAGMTQTILSLLPVSVLIASAIFYKEPINARSVWAVLIALAGVFILVWRDELEGVLG